jgi:hypothetical protein
MVVWNAVMGVFLVAWGAVRLLMGPGEWWSYIVMLGGASFIGLAVSAYRKRRLAAAQLSCAEQAHPADSAPEG